MERINFEQETRALESDLGDISNQCPEDTSDSYWQEARSLFGQEESVYNSLKDLAYLQENEPVNPANGMRLKAIIGKANKYGKITQLNDSKGRMTDDDEYEIEGIYLGHSNGYASVKVFRTNSKSISKLSESKKGKKVYIETVAGGDGSSFYDPQGFYRNLSEWGYSVINSRIEII